VIRSSKEDKNEERPSKEDLMNVQSIERLFYPLAEDVKAFAAASSTIKGILLLVISLFVKNISK